MQRSGNRGAKPGQATGRYDAAAIVNGQLERPKRTEAELVRARVRAKILRRVDELESELHSVQRDELEQQENCSRCSASPETAAAAERPCSASLARGNTAKHEVIKVATQILGRCLTNQNTDRDHTLELQLVHRMLTKECELLAIQSHMENAPA